MIKHILKEMVDPAGAISFPAVTGGVCVILGMAYWCALAAGSFFGVIATQDKINLFHEVMFMGIGGMSIGAVERVGKFMCNKKGGEECGQK